MEKYKFEFHPNPDAMSLHVCFRLPYLGALADKKQTPEWMRRIEEIEGIERSTCLGGYDLSLYKGRVFNWKDLQAKIIPIVESEIISQTDSDLITIGNGAKVKPGTTGLWYADPCGETIQCELAILNSWLRKDRIFLTQSEAEAQLVADGFIKIADGWIKSRTCGHFVVDSQAMRIIKGCVKIENDVKGLGADHCFLTESNAESFLDSERRKNQVQIGNGKWIDKDSTEYWFVFGGGNIIKGKVTIGELFAGPLPDQAFASLPEAEAKSAEIHKSLGHFKTADGVWVNGDAMLWSVYPHKIHAWADPVKNIGTGISNTYSTPEAAAAAWLKIVKEGK